MGGCSGWNNLLRQNSSLLLLFLLIYSSSLVTNKLNMYFYFSTFIYILLFVLLSGYFSVMGLDISLSPFFRICFYGLNVFSRDNTIKCSKAPNCVLNLRRTLLFSWCQENVYLKSMLNSFAVLVLAWLISLISQCSTVQPAATLKIPSLLPLLGYFLSFFFPCFFFFPPFFFCYYSQNGHCHVRQCSII